MTLIANPLLSNPTLGGGSLVIGETGAPEPTFAPDPGPAFVYPVRYHRPAIRGNSIKPYVRIRPRGSRRLRGVRLQFVGVSLREIDYIVTFFDQFEGGSGPFFWAPPIPVHSPLGMYPVLGDTDGASSSEETYFVKFAWRRSATGGETEGSIVKSRTRPIGKLLTVSTPVIPKGVDQVRLYIGTALDSEFLEVTQTVRTWTEPTSGFPAGGGPLAPSANTASPLLRWQLADDFEPTMARHDAWNVELSFLEVLI